MHFQTVFSAGKMVGYLPDTVRVDHVGFGVVLGEDRLEMGNTHTYMIEDIITYEIMYYDIGKS